MWCDLRGAAGPAHLLRDEVAARRMSGEWEATALMLGTRRSVYSRSISSGLTGRSVRPARRGGPGAPAQHGAQPAALPVLEHLLVASPGGGRGAWEFKSMAGSST